MMVNDKPRQVDPNHVTIHQCTILPRGGWDPQIINRERYNVILSHCMLYGSLIQEISTPAILTRVAWWAEVP